MDKNGVLLEECQVAERKLTLGDASVNAPTNHELQTKELMPHSHSAEGLHPGFPVTVSFQRVTTTVEARHAQHYNWTFNLHLQLPVSRTHSLLDPSPIVFATLFFGHPRQRQLLCHARAPSTRQLNGRSIALSRQQQQPTHQQHYGATTVRSAAQSVPRARTDLRAGSGGPVCADQCRAI